MVIDVERMMPNSFEDDIQFGDCVAGMWLFWIGFKLLLSSLVLLIHNCATLPTHRVGFNLSIVSNGTILYVSFHYICQVFLYSLVLAFTWMLDASIIH